MTSAHLANASMVPTGSAKAITLALTLAQAEKAMQDFTFGQADAIVDMNGRAYLLRPAQEHLQQDEQRLRAILDSCGDGIIVVDRGGLIVSQNRTATQMLGYAPDEHIGRSFFEFVAAKDLHLFHAAFFSVIEHFGAHAVVEFHMRAQDESYRPIEATVSRLQDQNSSCVVLTCRDVTIRRPTHAESIRWQAAQIGLLPDRASE